MVNGATNMATSTTMADIIIAQLPLAYLGEKSQVRLTQQELKMCSAVRAL